MASRLLQRGLTSSGAATTVTLCSWMGEQSTSKATSRVVSRSLERLAVARPPYSFWRQQCKVFSTKTTEAAVPLPPSKAAAAPFKGFLQWYEGHLEASPVKTKMVTGGILWGLGDLVAQLVPQVTFDGGKSDDDSSKERHFTYDFPRTSRAVIFGGLFHAPTSHVHFNFLEWMTVRAGITGLMIPVFKAVMEQFVYWSWISNSMYHGVLGAMQGMTPSQIYDRIADVLWETQKAQWVFWIPVQLLNFRFVPVRHQLNVVLVTSIVWTALLSAWYPPVEEEEHKKEAGVETKK